MIWRVVIAASAVLLVVKTQDIPTGSDCVPPRDGGENIVVKEGDCTVHWRCLKDNDSEKYTWQIAKCVDGTVYNKDRKICEPITEDNECQGGTRVFPADIDARTVEPGCSRKFICPSDFEFFIYPNWDDCSTFYRCTRGIVVKDNCSRYNRKYYNPSTFFCDDITLGNNDCLNRG